MNGRTTKRSARLRSMGVIAAAVVGGIGAGQAQAFSLFLFNGQPVVWIGATADRYLSPTTFPEGSDAETMVLESMGLWTIIPGAQFTYNAFRNPQDFPVDSFDGFSDTIAVDPSALDPGVLAVTNLVNQGAAWFDADVLINANPSGVGWIFEGNVPCEVIDEPLPSNGFSFLLVMVHEMGHALGLGHDPIGNEGPGAAWFIATMNPRYPSGGPMGSLSIVETHTDDRNGVRTLYPASGLSETDLALPAFTTGPELGRAVPVFAEPASAPPGATVSLRSNIANLGTTTALGVVQAFYLSADDALDAGDLRLGELVWDVAAADALEFGVDVDLPADLAAGDYWFASKIDDSDALAELYEDNNEVVYCRPFVVEQLSPEFLPIGQQYTFEGEPFFGPAPELTLPMNMSPVTYSLDVAPIGATIDASTGVVTWPDPTESTFLRQFTIRGTNGGGSSTVTYFVGVSRCDDVTGDGAVDVLDLNLVLSSFNQAVVPGSGGDVTGDGVVDVVDLNRILAAFNQPCVLGP